MCCGTRTILQDITAAAAPGVQHGRSLPRKRDALGQGRRVELKDNEVTWKPQKM